MKTARRKLNDAEKALAVFLTSPVTRAALETHDTKALDQAILAIGFDPYADYVASMNGGVRPIPDTMLPEQVILQEWFRIVQNTEDWKLAIGKTLWLPGSDQSDVVAATIAIVKSRIRRAVIFYTGSVPTFEVHIPHDAETIAITVTADGYYLAMGA